MTALERLAYLAGQVREDAESETTRTAYRRFLTALRQEGDGAELYRDPEAEALLGEIRDYHGWGARVTEIRRSVRASAIQRNRLRVVDGDGEDATPLETDRDGNLKGDLRNCVHVLSDPARGFTERLAFNEFTGRVEIDGLALEDADVTAMQVELHEAVGADFGQVNVERATEHVARTHRAYHPVREWLNRLDWDATPRLDRLLSDYMGCEDTALNAAFGRRWAISAVARIMQPGCKCDTMLVLQGSQGAGKSTAFRVLAGDWFRDTRIDPRTKDMYGNIRGVWVYEIGELDQWTHHTHAGALKSLLSSQVDTYRPPYARYDVEQPRQVVLVGTTNEPDFLTDPTGERRYWPARVVDAINLAKLRADRDQLWAEAVDRWGMGEQWHLTAPEAAAHAEIVGDYSLEFPEVEMVAEWLDGRGSREGFSTLDVLRHAFQLPNERANSGQGRRAADVLRVMGYSKRKAGGRNRWFLGGES